MSRPRAPLDPDILAALRDLGVRLPEDAAHPRRRAEPVGARLDVRYVLETRRSEARPLLKVWSRRVPPAPAPPGPWEPLRVSEKLAARLDDATDREILGAVARIEASSASRKVGAQDGAEDEPASVFALSHAAQVELLPRVAATGRLRVRVVGAAGERGADLGNVSWRASPWRFRIRANVIDAPGSGAPRDDAAAPWEVRGVVCADETEVPLSAIEVRLESGFAIAAGVLARFNDGGASSWLGLLETHQVLRITESRRASFLEELYALPAPPLDLPEGALGVEDAIAMIPRLAVRAPDSASPSAALRADLTFDYDGCIVAARRPGSVVFDAPRRRLVRRDLTRESEAERRLGGRVTTMGEPLSLPAARLPLLVNELLAEGWHVEAAGRKQRRATAMSLAVGSGVDWFDLRGEVRFGGIAVTLPRVLEALRRGDVQVILDDGSVGMLPDAWLARQGLVLRLGVAQGDAVRFSAGQLPLLAALSDVDPALGTDTAFDRARAALAQARVDRAASAPVRFVGELRPYQLLGVGFLRGTEEASLGALLADEMGLGKTIQVLAHLVSRPSSGLPSLVVAPRSLLFNWRREVARFAPSMRLLDHTGPDRRPPGPHFASADIVLTTYGTLRRDADALAGLGFDVVVLDEAQAIKNDSSDTATAARKLVARHRIALSGTPVENHLGELGSIVQFLNPGLFGRAAAWRSAADATRSPDGVALVSRAIQPFFLRRTKAEVAPDLPARLDETFLCELSDDERKFYEELRARFRSEILGTGTAAGERGGVSARVLEALLRLRQAACHPGLLDPARRGTPSTKVKALLAELVTLRESGQKALVFSQFRSLLDLVKGPLEEAGIPFTQLDGRTRDREAIVERFQADPSCAVMLVSLKAGGVGLNLTAAEYVFLLDPWWNPAAEAQAIDRAHRIGQTKPVFAYRLIARGTVEERIAELQEKKRMLADSVIRGDGAALKDLTRDDLDRLLS